MDRNTIVGILMIGAILIGWSYFSSPSQEEIERAQQKRDSLEQVALEKQKLAEERDIQANEASKNITTLKPDYNSSDSSQVSQELRSAYGEFSSAVKGENEYFEISNEKIKVTISKLGGRPYTVTLNDYQTYDSLPLNLMDGDSTVFGFTWMANQANRPINTQELFFEKVEQTSTSKGEKLVLRLNAGNDRYVDYVYFLQNDEYLLDFKVELHNLQSVIKNDYITFDWSMYMPSMEKGYKYEEQNSSVYYRYLGEDVDNLSESSDDDKKITEKIEWVAFKQQFFSSIIIPEKPLNDLVMKVKATETQDFVKWASVKSYMPYMAEQDNDYNFQFYFGPNKYNTLKTFEREFEELLPLGWGVFGWVNMLIVIPLFNWLGGHIASFGLIIFIMTIIIKMGLFPLTFKSYMSTAKMRVLKPEIDEINAKFPKKEDAMKKQQAVMALYKKAGANPMGGCLPMLLQMPFLIAMFRFFPASIELRQQSFWWADDLSSYDSILQLPFEIPMYGDHVSLWVLLMTIVNFVYMEMNNKNNPQSTGMPGMKTMMYIMPLFMLVFFNSYASALSYYYFVSLLITILQTWLFRKFVDDAAIRERINTAKKKPVKKSKFQQRMEQMAKQQQQNKKRK